MQRLPATAALAWAVLGYICVDFGFLSKLISITAGDERIWRAGTEVFLAAGLVVFLFTYLNLNRWHVRYSHVTAIWLVFLGALVGLAVIDPPVASGVARISIAVIAASSNVDVAFVMSMQIGRFAVVLMVGPALARWLTRRAQAAA